MAERLMQILKFAVPVAR